MASILIVESDGAELSRTVDAFNRRGYKATGVSTFQAAKHVLCRSPAPDVLIADVRLGRFNGLHLAVFAKRRNPKMTTIVSHEPVDSPLQSDADRLRVAFWPKPSEPSNLVSRLDQLFATSQATAISA